MTQIESISATTLTSFDWFLIALVALSTIAAFLRGAIKMLFSLGGVIAGILIASWNCLAFARVLNQWILNLAAAQITSFILILLLVMAVFTLAAALLRRTAAAVGLGFFDRLLGAALGLLRGILLGIAAMMVITAFSPKSPWVTGSRLAPYFLAGAHEVSFVVPSHLQQQITTGARHLLQQSPELFEAHPSTHPGSEDSVTKDQRGHTRL